MSALHKADITPTSEVTVPVDPTLDALPCAGATQPLLRKALVRAVVESRQWNCQEKASFAGASGGMDDLLKVDVSISQAPPSFRQPVTQRKPCTPPFKVQVSAWFGRTCSQLPVKVNAYALSKDSLASFLKQASQQSFAALPSDSGLANASIYKCLESHDDSMHKDEPYHGVHETFEFVDMHFKTSSRMALRWLLFVARIRDDNICIIYKRPTIVLSRKTDQYSKACSILANDHPMLEINDHSSLTTSQTVRPDSGVDLKGGHCLQMPQSSSSCNKDFSPSPQPPSIPADLKEWIVAAYNECHFSRGLSLHDLGFLAFKLGIRGLTIHNSTSLPPLAALSPLAVDEPWHLNCAVDPRRSFESFAKWFLACLVSLKRESALWCADDVVRICPFMVDRTISQDLLESEGVGTFIVRISSDPGSFVLSVKEVSEHGAYVEHYLIDALDLKRQNLSSWVMAHQSAQFLLDVRSATKFPKHFIFIESALSSKPSHFVNSGSSQPPFRNMYLPLFDSADSDGSSSPLVHKYVRSSVFGTS